MHFFRFVRLSLALAGLTAASFAHGLDLRGVYENTGSLFSSATPQPGGTISFQGLLELNFDYELTRILHAETNRVMIEDALSTGSLRIVCLDNDNQPTWSGQWEPGTGYTRHDLYAELTFRTPRLKDDGYVFSLRPLPGTELLLVEVQQITSTTLGPNVQPVGSFIFRRLKIPHRE